MGKGHSEFNMQDVQAYLRNLKMQNAAAAA